MATGCIIYKKLNGEPYKWRYAVCKYNGKKMGVHKRAWIRVNGPVPDGLYVCHRCDTPLCINVAHLFLGTPLDNMRDKVNKGRHRGFNPTKTIDGMRPCKKCRRVLPETDFHKNGISKFTGKVMRHHVCKDCRTYYSEFV